MAEGAPSPEAAAQAQAALLELLLGTLRRSDIVRCVNVASTCLFMYDHAVTFLDEVELIWPAAWGPGKILFLLARYLTWPELISGLIHQFFDVSGETCHNIFGYNSVSIVWGIGAAELILILRTWAIWNREKTLLIVLLVFFCAVWGPETYIIVELVKKTTFVPASSFSPALKGCIITASSQIVTNAWILLTAFEAIILALTLIKGYQHFSQGSSHLINLLYRDGILYFVYLFAISVANLVVVYTTEAEFTILLTQCVTTARSIRNLIAHTAPTF
ncbi:hypothetical protein EXIGLDRAFT_837149 [Exidia glandulosa HHB12029]|uniref:DUF6533 domain-containing protein n=1 Tax=Exidia glandulosa HHB12029 TaxID=1314781 RepID=A0A165H431_EXIGL|nr:hypothetical protein EXIGLDRAFT_837149 [Exidia glandulosa HHB12029]